MTTPNSEGRADLGAAEPPPQPPHPLILKADAALNEASAALQEYGRLPPEEEPPAAPPLPGPVITGMIDGEDAAKEIGEDIRTISDITVRLIQQMGGDHMVVAAARVSTCGEDALVYADPARAGECAGLINYLMAGRHGTPFEHSALSFFVHAPIFVWREWHRHRVGFSYNEESARYKKLAPVFWLPPYERPVLNSGGHTSARPAFRRGNDGEYYHLCDALRDSYRAAYCAYSGLCLAGYAKEVARACLPVGIYSSCWVTCNPRSLMHFLSLRINDPKNKFVTRPQAEIEAAARVAEDFLGKGWPLTYAAFNKNGRVAP